MPEVRQAEWANLKKPHEKWEELKVPGNKHVFGLMAVEPQLADSLRMQERVLHPDAEKFREEFAGKTLGEAFRKLVKDAHELRAAGEKRPEKKTEQFLQLASGLAKHAYIYDILADKYWGVPKEKLRAPYHLAQALAAFVAPEKINRVTERSPQGVLDSLNRMGERMPEEHQPFVAEAIASLEKHLRKKPREDELTR
jgi:hypothetical protein